LRSNGVEDGVGHSTLQRLHLVGQCVEGLH
jgi:hypothetical protein